MKPARLRPQAEQDLVDAARFYAEHAGVALGEQMIDAALAALGPVRRMPRMGSPRLGQLCGIPGLRAWRVSGFPLQWLYFDTPNHLDVVRLLGDRQDILAIMSNDD